MNFLPKTCAAYGIDTAMDRTPAQPSNAVGADGNTPMSFIELQENFLSHFFRNRRVMEEIAGDAVNHPLVFPDSRFKLGLRHLPSELITKRTGITTQKVLSPAVLWYPRPMFLFFMALLYWNRRRGDDSRNPMPTWERYIWVSPLLAFILAPPLWDVSERVATMIAAFVLIGYSLRIWHLQKHPA